MYAETRSKDLLLIPRGPDGLSMKYLASFIGQGKVYIRPIQQDLSLNEDAPLFVTQHEECRNGHTMVDLICLRDHYALCSKSKEGNSSKCAKLMIFSTFYNHQVGTRLKCLISMKI